MPIGALAGFGAAAGGLSQGFNQARLGAIQQAYLKMQQQHQEMLRRQMEFQQNRQTQADLAKPLESVFDKFPRLAGSVGPAIEGIRNPQAASYQPTLADQTQAPPEASMLERPEEQPVSGKAAVMPLIKNAYAQTAAAGQQEHEQDVALKRSTIEGNLALRALMAKNMMEHRGNVEQRAGEAAQRAKEKQARVPAQVDQKLRAQKEAIDFLGSLENTFSSPNAPATGGWLSLKTNPTVQKAGSYFGINTATPDEAAMSSQLGEHLISYIKGRFTRSAGWEVPLTANTTPQVGLPTQTNLARTRGLKEKMIRDHETDLRTLEQQGYNIPPELRQYNTRTPAQVLGQSIRPTPPNDPAVAPQTDNLGVYPGLTTLRPAP